MRIPRMIAPSVPRMTAQRTGRPGRNRGSYTQAERVMALYDGLLQGRTVRVAAAAEELGASERQIQRDLALVRTRLGERLEQRGDGGWQVPREKKRGRERRVALAQVLAMELGAKMSAFLWEPARMRAIQARVDVLREELLASDEQRLQSWQRRVAVIAPGQKDYAGRAEVGARLARLLDAMVEERPIDLSYRSHRSALAGLPARRLRVHPLGIVFYRDGVYFVVNVVGGSSPDLVGSRILLALDRIDDLALGDAGGFRVPRDFDARAFFGDAFGIWPEGEAKEVVVEIDAAHAPWLQERTLHRSQQIEQRTDGSLVVRMRVSGLHEIADWILSLGEHAEVVEPAELRDLVQMRLRAAAARYGEGGDIFRRPPIASSPSPRRGRSR
jgi:predicted DNA-binding transcriptional regulator YafY